MKELCQQPKLFHYNTRLGAYICSSKLLTLAEKVEDRIIVVPHAPPGGVSFRSPR